VDERSLCGRPSRRRGTRLLSSSRFGARKKKCAVDVSETRALSRRVDTRPRERQTRAPVSAERKKRESSFRMEGDDGAREVDGYDMLGFFVVLLIVTLGFIAGLGRLLLWRWNTLPCFRCCRRRRRPPPPPPPPRRRRPHRTAPCPPDHHPSHAYPPRPRPSDPAYTYDVLEEEDDAETAAVDEMECDTGGQRAQRGARGHYGRFALEGSAWSGPEPDDTNDTNDYGGAPPLLTYAPSRARRQR